MSRHASCPGRLAAALLLAAAGGDRLAASAPAQVAFAPVVSAFPNGVTLPVTPVVSADRRYVRMSLSPSFNGLDGFDTYSVPGAVSGGPGGPGALGGLGGGGGGGGGQRFAAGMDGVAPLNGADPRVALAAENGFVSHGAFAASPEAAALLSGVGPMAAPARLSDQMPDDPDARRARASAGSKRSRTAAAARSRAAARAGRPRR